MHDPVSPLHVFDKGFWSFRQMVQAQSFIHQSGTVFAELDLLLAFGFDHLYWQKGSHWYAVGTGLALPDSLLLVVARHNYDWWLFKPDPCGRLYVPPSQSEMSRCLTGCHS